MSVLIAKSLSERPPKVLGGLQSFPLWADYRQTGNFRVEAGGVGQNILLRMARSIPSKDDSVPHSLSSQSRTYFRMAHAARLFA